MADNVFALIRHGDYHQPKGVPSALLPYALNEAGIQQSRSAVDGLSAYAKQAGLVVDPQIHCSKQQRAWQTASIIADGLEGSYQVTEFPELSERSVGAAANLTVAEIEQLLIDDPRYESAPDGWKSDSKYRLPLQGAESLVEAGERVAGHIQSIARDLRDRGDVPCLKIIVGHGASIRHACASLNILDLNMVKSISMFHASPVYISEESGSWQVVGGEWKQRTNQSDGDEIRER